MGRTSEQDIRREKKKAYYLREISSFILDIARDEPLVAQLYVTRVELSNDGGICYLYFSSYTGTGDAEKEAIFKEARNQLVLYKPSLRKALASTMSSRYVPDLRFYFDAKKEAEMRVNEILAKVSDEIREEDEKLNQPDMSSDGE